MALKRARKRPGAARGAAHALGFFRDMLVHTKGEWAGQPFTLLPWQRAVVQALFGTRGPDGRRQYRRAYIEIPRKNGKTTWMAGLGLYLLLADGEPGAEIYCLDASTRVLTRDLRWVPLGDLHVGDGIVAFDEYPERPGGFRRLRAATITSLDPVYEPSFRLRFDDGRTLIASALHRWLAYRAPQSQAKAWRRTMDLKVGSMVRDLGPPWVDDRSPEGGYLAGVFDGEGAFHRSRSPVGRAGYRLAFAQKPGLVLSRTRELLMTQNYDISAIRKHASGVETFEIRGLYSCFRFLGSIRPLRLLSGAPGWYEGRAPRPLRQTGWARVAAIESLGVQRVLAVGTSTHTVFAEGLFSHNSAAADREQAAISFELARSMVEANPDLKGEVAVYRRELVVRSTESRYRVLSADAPTKHGLNAHGILFDELHAQPNRELFDVLWTSTGARRQPLSIAITTAGYDRTSVCWEQHDLAVKVRDGVVRDPTLLPVLYAAPPTADWTDPEVWAQANPSLGKTIKRDYLAAECRRAQVSPAYENTFRRLHLCQWTEQVSRWLPIEAWTACGATVSDAELVGVPAYGGLDLGAQDDFSAFVIVFPLADGRVALRTRYWLPETTVTERPHRPYGLWARQGHLTVTSGTTTDMDTVEAAVREDCARYAVREVAFDPRNALQLSQHLQNAGLVMIEQPQGFKLNEALLKLLALTKAEQFAHGGDPILAWMAGNMTVKHGTEGHVRPAKEMAADKIDGMVALAMALDRLIRQAPAVEAATAYADHGLFTV